MIETENIFLDISDKLALWVSSQPDTNSLATIANNIIDQKITLISATPASTSYLWTCLEKAKVKILSRFYFEHKIDTDTEISDLSEKIVFACKHGASGIQMFVNVNDLDFLIKNFSGIFSELFFDYEFSIGLDILDIPNMCWKDIFDKLHSLHVKSLTITMKEDAGNRSDFVGRVYGMLHNLNFDGDLYFELLNNYERMDEVIRLIECEKPELLNKIYFFVHA